MGVDDVAAVMLVAGEVHLHHALARKGREIGDRIGAGVEAADEHVVDVEQQAAVGRLGQPAQELRLLHGRLHEA